MRTLDSVKENHRNSRLPFFNNGEKSGFFDFQSVLETEQEQWFQEVKQDNISGENIGNKNISNDLKEINLINEISDEPKEPTLTSSIENNASDQPEPLLQQESQTLNGTVSRSDGNTEKKSPFNVPGSTTESNRNEESVAIPENSNPDFRGAEINEGMKDRMRGISSENTTGNGILNKFESLKPQADNESTINTLNQNTAPGEKESPFHLPGLTSEKSDNEEPSTLPENGNPDFRGAEINGGMMDRMRGISPENTTGNGISNKLESLKPQADNESSVNTLNQNKTPGEKESTFNLPGLTSEKSGSKKSKAIPENGNPDFRGVEINQGMKDRFHDLTTDNIPERPANEGFDKLKPQAAQESLAKDDLIDSESLLFGSGKQENQANPVAIQETNSIGEHREMPVETGNERIEYGDCFNSIDAISDSNLRTLAGDQLRIIAIDGLVSQEEIDTSSDEKEAETNAGFNQLLAQVTSGFEEKLLMVPNLIGLRSLSFLGNVLQRIIRIQQFAQQIVAGGWSMFANFTGILANSITNIAATANGFVTNAAARVLSLVGSIPLPDVPGVSRLREIVLQTIMGAFNRVQQFISRIQLLSSQVLINGISIFTGLVSRVVQQIIAVRTFYTNILNFIITQILHLTQMFVLQIIVTLRSRFFAFVLPFINRLRLITIRMIRRMQLVAKGEIIMNTNFHLIELSILASESDDKNPKEGKSNQLEVSQKADRMRAITESSKSTNRSIVSWYKTNLSTQIINAIQSVGTTLKAVVLSIWGTGMGMFNSLTMILMPYFTQAEQYTRMAFSFISNMLIHLSVTISRVLQQLLRAIGNAIITITRSVSDTVRSVRDRIFERIRNFVFGD